MSTTKSVALHCLGSTHIDFAAETAILHATCLLYFFSFWHNTGICPVENPLKLGLYSFSMSKKSACTVFKTSNLVGMFTWKCAAAEKFIRLQKASSEHMLLCLNFSNRLEIENYSKCYAKNSLLPNLRIKTEHRVPSNTLGVFEFKINVFIHWENQGKFIHYFT